MAQSFQLKSTPFFNFASFVLEVLNYFPVISLTSQSTLWAGLVGVMTSCGLGFFALKNSKNGMRISLFILFIICSAEIALGATIQNQLDALQAIVNGGATSSTTPAAMGTLESNTVHFQYAMFNECCGAKGWSKETFGVTDSGWDKNVDVPGIPPYGTENLDGTVKCCDCLSKDNQKYIESTSLPGSLLSCYHYQESYRQFNYTVQMNKDYICSTLSKATVDITGVSLPGSSEIKISGYTKGHTILPLVGYYDDPTFGCGAGYAKAFQAAQVLWIEQSLTPGATSMLVCGSVGLVFIIISIATSCSGDKGRETAEQAYERYMAEVQASQGANGRPMTQRFEQANPAIPVAMAVVNDPGNRMSVNSSYSQKSHHLPQQQNHHVAAYMESPHQSSSFNVDDKI